ncbi:borealin [Salarias fasciatus]|uniref:Uncharacterized protein n=1 Tax=Salarias fasciatus TaxID=181472 RepID=A0A672I0Q5_SALFA|nr:borealin [Salarias fasciatus]
MAPRKRTTKQQKINPRTAKLEAFLEDFDSEVKTRIGQLKEKLNQLLKDVDNAYGMALIKIPKAVRKTNWLEHYMSEKPKTPEVENSKREEEAAIVESVVAEDHAVLLKNAKKTPKKKRAAKSSSQDGVTPSTTRKARTTKKPPTTSKRAKALGVARDSTAIRRSSRKPLVTPARSLLDSSVMIGATPLVTPRFDPRLPKTPATRGPRHKERVFSISVNGSPIAGGSNDIFISVPVGNGESIQLLASQMDSVDLSLLDENALKSLRQLQTRLTSLCGTSQ